jgi:undecaprenyl-diphosphatase
MTFTQALILAVVEGLTEYLPVSSTGHIILTSWLMGIHENEFVKDYTVMVQFGAILAVVVLYWRKFILNLKVYPAVLIAFLPAAVVGLLVKKHIDVLLGSVTVVAVALLVGGVVLVWTDGWLKRRKSTVHDPAALSRASALKIGLFQLLAFIPGVSRSAASILGGLQQGMTPLAAAEFSFFLAAPTLTGASLIKLMKAWPSITPEQMNMILWGNVVSFVVGAAAIHTFVKMIAKYGFKWFGVYRILVGAAVLIFL